MTAPAPAVYLSPDFFNVARPDATRVRFCFTAIGAKQTGTLYVNANVPAGYDWKAEAKKAATIACKRAGATSCTLHNISNPDR